MARRQIGLWAGAVLGAMLLGCQSTTAPVSSDRVVSKGGSQGISGGMEFGPAGGVLEVGNYTLVVPPGALANTTHLSINQESMGQWPVTFGPEGTQFAVPVTLSFNASAEEDPAHMTVAWWNPSTGQWVNQTTQHAGDMISTQASHFSRFILQ